MARVTTVSRARKSPGPCSKCGAPIGVGDPYRHASPGFRGRKIVRCMRDQCRHRPSDLTTSKMSTVYAAIEAAEDGLPDAANTDDIGTLLDPVAEAAREVADEYREAAEAMGDAGADNEERADDLDAFADECDQFDEGAAECSECGGSGHLDEQDPATPDADEMPECVPCDGTGTDIEAAREAAEAILSECP